MQSVFEMNIRKYARWIVSGWRWIVLLTMVAAAAALILSSIMKPVYEAKAMAVTLPRNIVYLGSSGDLNAGLRSPQLADRAYLDLANSDQIVKQVYEAWQSPEKSTVTIEDFRNSVISATAGSASSVIVFKVQLSDPVEATRLANLWADAFVNLYKKVYGDAAFLDSELTKANEELSNANQALVTYQSENQLPILQNRLSSLTKEHADYLAMLRNIHYQQQKISDFRKQIETKSGKTSLTMAEKLNALLIEIRAYDFVPGNSSSPVSSMSSFRSTNSSNTTDGNSQSSSEQLSSTQGDTTASQTPLVVNIDNLSSLPASSYEEATITLDNILNVLKNREVEINKRLVGVEPEITSLQSELEKYQNETDRLMMEKNVAENNVLSLKQKMQEVRIADESSDGSVRIAGMAEVPQKPMPRNRVRNTLIAAVVGAMIATLGVFAREWWREENIVEVTPAPAGLD